VLFAAIEQITEYREHLKAGIEMADAAVARLLMVGQSIVDEAEASHA
jgi:hypothetical protein